MVNRTWSVALALVVTLVALPRAWSQDSAPTQEQVRQAIDRSLPFLEKEGTAWIQKRACMSCHTVTFMLWSHAEAQAKGVKVDPQKMAGWTDWSLNDSMSQRTRLKLTDPGLDALKGEAIPAETLAKLAPLTKKPAVKEGDFLRELAKVLSPEEISLNQASLLKHASKEKGDGGGLDTMNKMLLAGVYGGQAVQESAFVTATRTRIVELQQADWSWKPGGQLGGLGRSPAEATEVTTMWTVLSLSGAQEATVKPGVERALAFIRKAKPGKTNEGLLLRALVEKEFGDPELSRALLQEVLAHQNPDGGWAWLQGAASDAFATGQVLYAACYSGPSGDDAAIQRARTYLVETQGKDGSWTVPPSAIAAPSTLPDRIKKLEPIYRYWGTAWATIGLARSLPAKP
jgi:hypothetical protein